jgi:hypothetical protein
MSIDGLYTPSYSHLRSDPVKEWSTIDIINELLSLLLPPWITQIVQSRYIFVEHLPTPWFKNHPSLEHFPKCKVNKVFGAITSNKTFITFSKICKIDYLVIHYHGLPMNVLGMASQLWPNELVHAKTSLVHLSTKYWFTSF